MAFLPTATASYAIPVRQVSALPSASFRFQLTMDTLAVRLTVPLAGPVEDFHLQVVPGGHRSGPGQRLSRRFAPCLAHHKKARDLNGRGLAADGSRCKGYLAAASA